MRKRLPDTRHQVEAAFNLKQRKEKENQAKSKGMSKRTKSENKGFKGATGSCKDKTSKTVSQFLKLEIRNMLGNSGISANGTGLYH